MTDFQARSSRKLDASGLISCDCDSSKQNAVLVPTGNGGQTIVSLSEGEHKTVDLRERMVIFKTVKYNGGFIRSAVRGDVKLRWDMRTSLLSTGRLGLLGL